MPDIVLYQPDIPQNTGTIMRTGACLGVTVHIVEPAGFALSDAALKRAGMDYLARAELVRHISWQQFETWHRRANRRLVLFTTAAQTDYTDFAYRADDLLLFGRESAGGPDQVHQTADARVVIPMVDQARSLNLAVSCAMAIGEALRQCTPCG